MVEPDNSIEYDKQVEYQRELERQQVNEIETFFCDAFCCDSAELLPDTDNYEILGVLKMTKHDGEIFYVARVEHHDQR